MSEPARVAETRPGRPALRWRGGKWRVAEWIIANLPPHECYVEPYMGAASVLLQKPRSTLEVLNDLDDRVVAFFRCLRDRPAELAWQIQLTPYARRELALSILPAENDLEKARRLYVSCLMGRGATSKASGFRFQKQMLGFRHRAASIFYQVDHLFDCAARLRSVQIEHKPALDILRQFDAPTVLFYVDPPYVPDSRTNSRNLYSHEMRDPDHVELAEVLRSLSGMVVLSGGVSGLYERLFPDWLKLTREALGEGHKRYLECLWLNPAAVRAQRQLGLFTGGEGC